MRQITLDQWRNTHIDYKGYIEGAPYILVNENGATVSVPVEIDRSAPAKITPDKFIGVWTSGLMAETPEIRESIERAFMETVKDHEDHLYIVKVVDRKFFVAANGEMGYTAMLPDEY